ncbi:MAG: hypothetical protein ABSA82_02470 [Thermacetogeniaceae bacterium]|jgi:hypothetical protein
MKILNSQYNIFFPNLTSIRQQIFTLEDKLGDKFQTPFNLLPIPDTAPSEIPRITAMSKLGHSQLQFSLSSMSLATGYDDNFNSDWNKCSEYIDKRIENLIPVIGELIDWRFLYSGLVVVLQFDETELNEEPIQFMINRFLNLNSSRKPFDIDYKITFALDETFYMNMNFKNYRSYEGLSASFYEGLSDPYFFSPAYLQLKETGLNLMLDVNDKYGFNNIRGYVSDRESYKKLLDLVGDVLNKNIMEILEKGVFSI